MLVLQVDMQDMPDQMVSMVWKFWKLLLPAFQYSKQNMDITVHPLSDFLRKLAIQFKMIMSGVINAVWQSFSQARYYCKISLIEPA